MADGLEDLLDYNETDETPQATGVKNVPANGSGTAGVPNGKAGGGMRGTYVSIHASGFKDFLLKPELLRAIMDCGFEHPSEGFQTSRLAKETDRLRFAFVFSL